MIYFTLLVFVLLDLVSSSASFKGRGDLGPRTDQDRHPHRHFIAVNKRKVRAKKRHVGTLPRHLQWEQFEIETGGLIGNRIKRSDEKSSNKICFQDIQQV
jgi:hypothetical protein